MVVEWSRTGQSAFDRAASGQGGRRIVRRHSVRFLGEPSSERLRTVMRLVRRIIPFRMSVLLGYHVARWDGLMRRAVGQRLRRFRIVSIIWEADRASYHAGMYDCRLEGVVDARKSRKIPGDGPAVHWIGSYGVAHQAGDKAVNLGPCSTGTRSVRASVRLQYL